MTIRCYGNGLILCSNDSAGNISAGAWHNVIVSCRFGQTTGAQLRIAIDGKYIAGTGNSIATLDVSTWKLGILNSHDGSRQTNSSIYDFVFYKNKYLDLSVSADLATNVQKFRTANGKPADLGSDGSKPFGVAPDIYLKGDSKSFGVNSGTAGDFTVNGTFTDVTGPN